MLDAAAAAASVVSNSAWPHRRQPTRLPRPWDSPGKDTGVGCYFLLQCMTVKSEREVAQSCPTLSSPPGSSIHGIFQARVLEWGAIAISDLKERMCQKCQNNVFSFSSMRTFSATCKQVWVSLSRQGFPDSTAMLSTWTVMLNSGFFWFFGFFCRKWIIRCIVVRTFEFCSCNKSLWTYRA